MPVSVAQLLDPVVLPECASYLEALDGDLDALPDCMTRTEFFTDILGTFPHLFDDASIKPPLRRRLEQPWADEQWVPSVLVVLALTMVRDRVHHSDEAFLHWNTERQLRMYRKPMFRALVFVLSPTLLFMGAARRWTAFHRGSTLTVAGAKHDARLVLEFPENLYSRVFLLSLVAAFRAALVAARAENPSIEMADAEPTRAVYRARWG